MCVLRVDVYKLYGDNKKESKKRKKYKEYVFFTILLYCYKTIVFVQRLSYKLFTLFSL
jgi:hypothetical protein